jgi:hypothetical protein
MKNAVGSRYPGIEARSEFLDTRRLLVTNRRRRPAEAVSESRAVNLPTTPFCRQLISPDDQKPVAPLPVLHIHAAPFQLRTQGIQHADSHRSKPVTDQNRLPREQLRMTRGQCRSLIFHCRLLHSLHLAGLTGALGLSHPLQCAGLSWRSLSPGVSLGLQGLAS